MAVEPAERRSLHGRSGFRDLSFKLTVFLFAAAREKARRERITITLSPGATVEALRARLLEELPALGPLMPHLRVAVNEEMVEDDAVLVAGDEVAMIPPVAGGAPERYCVVDRPLNAALMAELVATPSHGGVVTFVGAVRDQTKGRPVTKLEYEAYASMAQKVLARLGADAAERWPGLLSAIAHRVGTLFPGEPAVVIATSAPHRAEAFAACQYLLERLKAEAPIWKKEHFVDGEVWVGLGA